MRLRFGERAGMENSEHSAALAARDASDIKFRGQSYIDRQREAGLEGVKRSATLSALSLFSLFGL